MPVPRCPECGRVLLISGECENGCAIDTADSVESSPSNKE